MKPRPVTQLDIAKRLSVSRVTVSKALRNHPDISSEMKDRVNKAVEEMRYSPNLIARQLSVRKTFTIGVVVPDLENSFFAYLTDSIIDKADESNYHIILTVSRESGETQRQNILNLIGMRVDGLLVCVSQSTKDKDIFNYVREIGIPIVFFDRAIRNSDFSFVVFNDKKGTTDAINQIVKEGYRKIAHFAGYNNINIGEERRSSYKAALKNNKIVAAKEWIIEGGYEIEDGYRAFKKLRSAARMPEIILAVNDRVALGAYRAIKEAGLKIPEDIAVVRYGFSETAQLFNPSLSVINQNPRIMGSIAAKMLIDEIQGLTDDFPSEIFIEEDFQWNNSLLRGKSS